MTKPEPRPTGAERLREAMRAVAINNFLVGVSDSVAWHLHQRSERAATTLVVAGLADEGDDGLIGLAQADVDWLHDAEAHGINPVTHTPMIYLTRDEAALVLAEIRRLWPSLLES